MNTKISILMPTAGERIDGMMYQIHACLNQSYKSIQLDLLVDTDSDEKYEFIKAKVDAIGDDRLIIHRVPVDYRGKHGHAPIRWAIETLNLADWFLTTGDDDAIMPWTVQMLVDKMDDKVDTIIGKCLPVRRDFDAVNMMLGVQIKLGYITGSCCLYRTARVKEVGYSDSRYEADWDIIVKMTKYPYKIINTVMFVMPQSF